MSRVSLPLGVGEVASDLSQAVRSGIDRVVSGPDRRPSPSHG